jgi:hypothetical protein
LAPPEQFEDFFRVTTYRANSSMPGVVEARKNRRYGFRRHSHVSIASGRELPYSGS